MTDFLARLAARALGQAPVLEPRIRSTFEPEPSLASAVDPRARGEPSAATGRAPAEPLDPRPEVVASAAARRVAAKEAADLRRRGERDHPPAPVEPPPRTPAPLVDPQAIRGPGPDRPAPTGRPEPATAAPLPAVPADGRAVSPTVSERPAGRGPDGTAPAREPASPAFRSTRGDDAAAPAPPLEAQRPASGRAPRSHAPRALFVEARDQLEPPDEARAARASARPAARVTPLVPGPLRSAALPVSSLAPARRREDPRTASRAAEPALEVSIGRIEIAAAPAPARSTEKTRPRPRTSLEDHLARRRKGAR